MNGYTSAIVALLENGLKTTRATTPPVAVFADPQVLVEAPRELTLAGLGDLVSKPFCGCDWKIASLVKGEYYCPMPNRLLSEPFEQALEIFPRLSDDDPAAYAHAGWHSPEKHLPDNWLVCPTDHTIAV